MTAPDRRRAHTPQVPPKPTVTFPDSTMTGTRRPPESRDHPVELFRVAPDVDVAEGDLSTRVVLTGRGRVGSGVLSEDLDEALFHSSSALMIAGVVRFPSTVSRFPAPLGYYRKDAWRRGFSPSGYFCFAGQFHGLRPPRRGLRRLRERPRSAGQGRRCPGRRLERGRLDRGTARAQLPAAPSAWRRSRNDSRPAWRSSRGPERSSSRTTTRSTTTFFRSRARTGSTSASTGAAPRRAAPSRSPASSACTATSTRRWSASSWSWTSASPP